MPPLTLRSMVEDAAVQTDAPFPDLFHGTALLLRESPEGRKSLYEPAQSQAASKVFRIGFPAHPARNLCSRFRIVATDKKMPRMADAPVAHIPDEGVIAGTRVRQLGKPFISGHHMVGDLHQMSMIQSQRYIANFIALFVENRRRPADDSLESPAGGVFLPGISTLRFHLDAFRRLIKPALHIGTNDR